MAVIPLCFLSKSLINSSLFLASAICEFISHVTGIARDPCLKSSDIRQTVPLVMSPVDDSGEQNSGLFGTGRHMVNVVIFAYNDNKNKKDVIRNGGT